MAAAAILLAACGEDPPDHHPFAEKLPPREPKPPAASRVAPLKPFGDAPGALIAPLEPNSWPLPPPAMLERLRPDQSGIDLQINADAAHPLAGIFSTSFGAGGIAAGDVDADGLPDLFFSGGPAGPRLYLQLDGPEGGPLKFADATAASGAAAAAGGWGAGCAMVDLDADGDLDILGCRFGAPCYVLVNDGVGGFAEGAAAFGLAVNGGFAVPALADYDGDGDLDLFLAALEGAGGSGAGKLFRNTAAGSADGQPRFVEATADAGLGALGGSAVDAAWADFDGDARPDLYIARASGGDLVFRNLGEGKFAPASGRAFNRQIRASGGVAVADFDADGRPDLFRAGAGADSRARLLAEIAAPPGVSPQNGLFLNRGALRFQECAAAYGIARTGMMRAAAAGDFDADGRIDLLALAGAPRDFLHADHTAQAAPALRAGANLLAAYAGAPVLAQPGRAWRGEAGGFADASVDWGLDAPGVNLAMAAADLDRDGDLDLIEIGLGAPARVLANAGTDPRGILVRLRGTGWNTFGIGARLEFAGAAGQQVRWIAAGGSEPVAHLGLGKAESLAKLDVVWPSGARQELRDLPANHRFELSEPPAPPVPLTPPPAPNPIFAEPNVTPAMAARPPADLTGPLPSPPVMAWGDADGDGDADCYLGGERGAAGRLLLNDGSGAFADAPAQAFADDAGCADSAAAFFDADGDGDFDLYVGSGDGGPLRDRLYLNGGSADFARAPAEALPEAAIATGCVAPADYDADGDIDLFVGAASEPGRWPEPGASQLLRNLGGARFQNVATAPTPEDKLRSPDLAGSCLAAAALWADFDGDGAPDLLVAAPWGAIEFFRNSAGRLTRRTGYAELAPVTGLWNCLAARDIDGDGDLDFAAGNLGSGTPYSSGEGALALMAEPGGRSALAQITPDGAVLPWQRLESMAPVFTNAPIDFPTASLWSQASAAEAFGRDFSAHAKTLRAAELRSGWFENDGSGQFSFHPFPPAAQAAPIASLALSDFDGDGLTDCAVAQNWGAGDAALQGGRSWLLRGAPGGFRAADPLKSGFSLGPSRAAIALCDQNGDAAPDLAALEPGTGLSVFENQAPDKNRAIIVALGGLSGAPGATVRVVAPRVPAQAAAAAPGQPLAFGLGASGSEPTVEVIWPDGRKSRLAAPADQFRLRIDPDPPSR